ncbi:MAG: hypothetical protein ACFNUL_10290 [Cardiobacterium hominis]
MMTPEQKAAIAAQLGADLSKLDNDQLIELCVLYRAQPSAHDTFPNALATEINRRFTPVVIKAEGVFYGVLQHFANQFQSAIPRFHAALLEMAGTVNRDIWFTDHEALFRSAIDNDEVAAWLAAKAQEDILNKCLRNRIALGYLAQSQTTATAILGNETACALWKDAPDLWQVWPQHRTGMAVVAKSAELTQYIIDTPAALAAVVASDNAMQALIASPTARRIWADSEVAMQAVAGSDVAMRVILATNKALALVIASQTAMTAVAASQTAMTAVASVTAALKTVLKTNDFRTALMASNTVFQAARAAAYQTVSTSGSGWVKQRAQDADVVTQLNQSFATPTGFVFACLGYYGTRSDGRTTLFHPGGTAAATAGSRSNPTSMLSVDGISFNGATFTETGDGYAYAELWAPA